MQIKADIGATDTHPILTLSLKESKGLLVDMHTEGAGSQQFSVLSLELARGHWFQVRTKLSLKPV
jgi:hypothetical protein